MRKATLFGSMIAVAIAMTAMAGPASAQMYYGGGYGPGMMGPGMMGPGMGMGPGVMGMIGPGMGMGPGMMGPGMMGWGWGGQPTNLNLSTNDVKTYLERWVSMTGNSHIKVGTVTEKDANSITADIVTTDKDALVQRYNVDRRSGFWQPVQ